MNRCQTVINRVNLICLPLQLGHQAVNCTNGTINWRQIYGDDAFTIKPPVYWSEYAKKMKKKDVDIKELEKRAREYARVRAGVIHPLCAVKKVAHCNRIMNPWKLAFGAQWASDWVSYAVLIAYALL